MLNEPTINWYNVLFGVAFFSIFIGYGIVTIRSVNNFHKIRDDYYSYHNENVSIKWIRILVIVFYIFYAVITLFGILRFFGESQFQISNLFVMSYTVFLYIISFKGYRQTRLLANKNIERENEKSYKKSGLKREAIDGYIGDILNCMKKEKPWLNDEVTVNDISIRTGIPKHYITQVLNEKLSKNFYTLINEYRTDEAIRLFGIEKYKRWTIEAIAYESGFNSKSSFNNFFKKYKGQTPSEFRKNIG